MKNAIDRDCISVSPVGGDLGAQRQRAYLHFRSRLHERISPTLDALSVWRRMTAGVLEMNGDVEFVIRLHPDTNRRVWRSVSSDAVSVYFVFDHNIDRPVTVYGPGMVIRPYAHQGIEIEATP